MNRFRYSDHTNHEYLRSDNGTKKQVINYNLNINVLKCNKR